jgi:hypothetical protein
MTKFETFLLVESVIVCIVGKLCFKDFSTLRKALTGQCFQILFPFGQKAVGQMYVLHLQTQSLFYQASEKLKKPPHCEG